MAMSSPQQAFFFVHMLRRFADDFKAVPNHLAAHDVATTVYSQPPPSSSGSAPSLSGFERLDRDRASFDARVSHAELPLQRASASIRDAFATMREAWRLGREHPDALYVMWTIVPIVLVGIPLRLQGRRCVFMKTGMGSVFAGHAPKDRLVRTGVRLVYRFLFSGANSRIITHNYQDLDYIVDTLGVARSHLAATPGCGVEPNEFPRHEPPDNPVPIILVPVRLLREKGVLDAVEASRLLNERGIEHRLWLSSDVDPGNPSSLTHEELAAFEHTVPSVEVLGFQDQVQPLYEQCDFVLVPTKYREGLPTALIESAASGRVVVTTVNYGGDEIIQDGVTGFLVAKGDAVAMADHLQELIQDRPAAAHLADAAYDQFTRCFTKDHMLQRTLELYHTLGLDVPDVDLEFDDTRFIELQRATP